MFTLQINVSPSCLKHLIVGSLFWLYCLCAFLSNTGLRLYLCLEVDIGTSLDQQVADIGVAIVGCDVQGCEPALKVKSRLVQTP